MKLSIVIPVHNEERFITSAVKSVFDTTMGIEKEIVIVDDGSTDSTSGILAGLKSKYDFVLVTHKVNRGKGAALRTGFTIIKYRFSS